MYYRKCPDCGAYLDPGERCDCAGLKRVFIAPKARKPPARPVAQVKEAKSCG